MFKIILLCGLFFSFNLKAEVVLNAKNLVNTLGVAGCAYTVPARRIARVVITTSVASRGYSNVVTAAGNVSPSNTSSASAEVLVLYLRAGDVLSVSQTTGDTSSSGTGFDAYTVNAVTSSSILLNGTVASLLRSSGSAFIQAFYTGTKTASFTGLVDCNAFVEEYSI